MGRKGSVDHGNYKRLEKMTKKLKMGQIQRRLGGNDLLNLSDTGEVIVSLEPDTTGGGGGGSATELPKISSGKKKDPAFEVPDRLNDDPGYVDRLFPRNAKKRNDREMFQKTHGHIRALKVDLIESIDGVDKKIRAQKDHARDLKETLKQLRFQDNIMQERRAYREKIEHEKSRLERTTLETARLTHYTRTLDAMLKRLHDHQISFVRTQTTYTRAVELQRREAREVREIAEEVHAEREVAEGELKALKRTIRRKEDGWMAKIKELQVMQKQREKLLRDMEDQQRELARRTAATRRQKSASQTRDQFNNTMTVGKLGAFNQHVRAHEMAFTKIRMVTGLKEESEILARYENQQAYLNDIEGKIKELTKELRVMEGRVNKLRSDVDVKGFSDAITESNSTAAARRARMNAALEDGGGTAEETGAAVQEEEEKAETEAAAVSAPTDVVATEKDQLDALNAQYEEASSAAKGSQQDLHRLGLMVLSMRQSCSNIMNEARSAERCLPPDKRSGGDNADADAAAAEDGENDQALTSARSPGAGSVAGEDTEDAAVAVGGAGGAGSGLGSGRTGAGGRAEEEADAVETLRHAQAKINAFMDELIGSVTELRGADGRRRSSGDADAGHRIDLDSLTLAEHYAQTSALVAANRNNIRVARGQGGGGVSAGAFSPSSSSGGGGGGMAGAVGADDGGAEAGAMPTSDNNRSQNAAEEDLEEDAAQQGAMMMPTKGKGGLSVASAADNLELLDKAKTENAMATRLRRIQLRTGQTQEEVEEEVGRIPREHVDQVMDRRALKYAAINLVRKVQKPKKKKKGNSVTARLAAAAHDD